MALGKGLGSLIPQYTVRKVIRKETGIAPPTAEQLWRIPISEIVANPEQPRRDFSHQDMEELVASITQHGILQPLIVSARDDGGYELIAGERRLRAAHIAGLSEVPALVRSATQQEKLEFALIENIQRQSLNPIEEAFAYDRLMNEFGLTQQDVADRVGKKRSTVANLLRLLALPGDMQKALIDGKLTVGKAKAILSLSDPRDQMRVFRDALGEELNVQDVERRVAGSGKSRKGSVRRDPNLAAQEALVEERLGTKVRITRRGEKGAIVIEYYSQEELKRLLQELT